MDRRAEAQRVGTVVSKAITAAGKTPTEIAEAIGLTSDEMSAHLSGASEFSAPQLVEIGGLLSVPASTLLRCAA
jgi:plasmid maintenance system antidote protein VapI